ncbi:hypothetical protein AMECASPLE_021666 [Ameca splendens]|uniref:Mif2/CENP-C cupin domain-containing protein n=1 Tax=Ameca splendens TaxID=208324 RepID=A0ABV0ZNE6_9TELE
METKYPALKRPRRKLCFSTKKKSLSSQLGETFTNQGVDNMFDDKDVCALEPHPPSVLFQSSDSGTNISEASISPVPQEKHSAKELPEHQISLQCQGPRRHFQLPATSSPISKLDADLGIPFKAHGPIKTSSPIEHNGVTPILFNSEDEAEEPQADPVPTQKPQCDGQGTEDGDENIKKSVGEARKKPEVASPKRKSTQPPAEPSSCGGKDMAGFLKTFQLTRMSKPSCSQKPPVKAPPLLPPSSPEPEDDFLILDDDAPLQFSIPRKSASSKRHRLSKSSSSNKESSTDKETKDGPVEVPQKQKEVEMATSKLDGHAVHQKMTKKKDKEKKPEVVKSDNDKGDSPTHQDLPADETIVEPEEETAQKTVTKKHKSTKRKNLKGEKDIAAKGGRNSLKEKRKQAEASKAVWETEHGDVFRQLIQEHNVQEAADTEDLSDFTDKHINFVANGEAKQDKKSAESTSSSSEDAQLLRKRKRRQPGEWWMSCPQSQERTENLHALKKSKQNSKEPSTAVPWTLNNKKDKLYSRKNPKEPVKLSSNHTNKVKGNNRKQTKRRNARDEKIKEISEKIITAKAELEDQQIPDEDPDPESSPLVFSKRDHGISSGPASQLCQPKEQLGETEPTKRRSKPPGEWWVVSNEPNDLEIITSQPWQPPLKEPKHQKKREKLPKQKPSRLGAPKNGNVASKTPGGAPVTHVRPLSTPKTLKRCLETFKDIFTSVGETPTMARDARQCKRRNVTSQAVEESPDTGPATYSRPDVRSGADVDECSQPDLEILPERACQTEDTFRVLSSGPSSMIELEKYDYDDDDMKLPSSRVRTWLSVSDFCAPPLEMLALHSKDKEYLTEWFQSLWSTGTGGGTTVTPDQFQWYFYQDRALGIQVDINSSSICSGKLVMGSYMKKPLWVDHSATTIFNLLTNAVSVTVDGSVSHYSAGQAFMVECGRAYSIHNKNVQPAALYFTRMLAESSDRSS